MYKNYKICEFLPRGQTLGKNMKMVIKRNATEGRGMVLIWPKIGFCEHGNETLVPQNVGNFLAN